ncbi:hypothetical protein NMY22_g9032 [Coprinellus aureogranulatus]|nr:hypothetical protein NMY22_g9032 [Coprinellus aureogranulatus]
MEELEMDRIGWVGVNDDNAFEGRSGPPPLPGIDALELRVRRLEEAKAGLSSREQDSVASWTPDSHPVSLFPPLASCAPSLSALPLRPRQASTASSRHTASCAAIFTATPSTPSASQIP